MGNIWPLAAPNLGDEQLNGVREALASARELTTYTAG